MALNRLFPAIALSIAVGSLFSARLLFGATTVLQNNVFTVEQVGEGLQVPWGMTFISENEMLITERPGSVAILDISNGAVRPVAGAPEVWAKGQGGLLDVVASPDYKQDGWLYFTYSKPVRGKAATTLARARLEGTELRQWQDLLVTDSAGTSGRHFGSRLVFVGEHLYMTVGDRGHRPNGQDLATHAGSILRLDHQGNAAAGGVFTSQGGRAEIWSYGHRNPQGIAWDPENKRLWAIEHGPRGGDELNLIRGGENYGWAKISHGKEYWGPKAVGEATEMEGYASASKVYTPSIAPSSLLLYSGKAFPQWRGDLFSGALKLMHINRLELNGAGQVVAEERLLNDMNERIRALVEGPEGWIYFSTDSGRVLRIRPSPAG